MEAIILGTHIMLCVLIWFLRLKRIMISSNEVMPIVICIPLWGALLAVFDEYAARKKLSCSKQFELEKLALTDKRYRSIEMDDSQNQQITVPLEEAMLINDAKTRRALMLDILHRNPNEYVNLLKRSRFSEDVELTHYATTTIMEIQSDYENQLQQSQMELQKDPENIKLLHEYEKVLKSYINSGLLSGNILIIERVELQRILEKLCSIYPEDRNLCIEYIQNELELGNTGNLEPILQHAKECWPGDERIYMLFVRYYRNSGQGHHVKDILAEVKEKNVYLTREGKEWYAFFHR